MRWVINGYLFLIIALLALFYFVIKYPEQFDLLIVINMAIITPHLYLITLKGLTQPTLWQVKAIGQKENIEKEILRVEEIELNKSNADRVKSQKTALANDKIGEMASQILQVMERDKLYMEAELTLQDLANRLQCPSHQVSLAINEGLNKNFYDVINGYRVEEAKRLLIDPKNQNFTILSVAFDAGFNSKTTFNTVFKKFTGLTPSEYRQQKEVRVA
jgi:AraC-like DNA-binding protein